MLPSFTWSNCNRKILLSIYVENVEILKLLWSYRSVTNVVRTFVRITEKISPEDKLSTRRMDMFYDQDRQISRFYHAGRLADRRQNRGD